MPPIDSMDELDNSEVTGNSTPEEKGDASVTGSNSLLASDSQTSPPPMPPPPIPPTLSLDLRVRWLETLIWGAKQQGVKGHGKGSHTLMRSVEELQERLDVIVQSSEGLRRFMDHYEQHAHLLTPSFALSGSIPTSPPPYESMSPNEVEAFLTEMEQDIRAADRDLREIDMLEKKDVTAAGKLPDYEGLQPRVEKLIQAHEEDLRLAAELEKKVASLMDRYATNVDVLSELFVAWDDAIQDAEHQVISLARDIEERRRLGYE